MPREAHIDTDVAIIGAGTAGLSALREVRKRGRRCGVIDPGPLGTTCARVGCMPSNRGRGAGLGADQAHMLEGAHA